MAASGESAGNSAVARVCEAIWGGRARMGVKLGTSAQVQPRTQGGLFGGYILEGDFRPAGIWPDQFPSAASSATFQRGERFTGLFRRVTDMNPFSLGVARVTLQDGRHVFS